MKKLLLQRLVATALLVSMSACSLAISGPSGRRPPKSPPLCDTGKGLAYLDGTVGVLYSTIAAYGLAKSNDSARIEGLVFGGLGATMLLMAFYGSSKVDRCRAEFEKYDREMTALLMQVSSQSTSAGAMTAPPSASTQRPPSKLAAPAKTSPGSAPAESAPSSEDGIRAQARHQRAEGFAAQHDGNYDAALDFYRRSYELVPLPVLLFNLAQVHHLKGEKARALGLYRQYLAVEERGAHAEEARRWVQALESEGVEE